MFRVGDQVGVNTGSGGVSSGEVRAVFELWDGGPIWVVIAFEPMRGGPPVCQMYPAEQVQFG